MTDRVPVAENLFEFSGADVALIGSRCLTCGTHYFPKAVACRNPECDGETLETTLLGRRGRLYSWTVQAYQPPPLFRMQPWAPYAVGLVEIPEGLRVMAMLTSDALDELAIDMPMDLIVEPLYVDDAGAEVLTYKYRPGAAA